MTRGERVFLDTNVLLAATDRSRAAHADATAVFAAAPGAGLHLCVSAQVIREYVAVATRPVAANGLGLSLLDTQSNTAAFLAHALVLPEGRTQLDRLLELVYQHEVQGKAVHDANIVATMLESGVTYLITDNTADFARYAGLHLLSPAQFVQHCVDIGE